MKAFIQETISLVTIDNGKEDMFREELYLLIADIKKVSE